MVVYVAIGGVAFMIYNGPSAIHMVETVYIFNMDGSGIRYMVWVGGAYHHCRNYLLSNLLKGWRKKNCLGRGGGVYCKMVRFHYQWIILHSSENHWVICLRLIFMNKLREGSSTWLQYSITIHFKILHQLKAVSGNLVLSKFF